MIKPNVRRGILRAIAVLSVISAVVTAVNSTSSPPLPRVGPAGTAFLGAALGAGFIWVLAGIGWILYRMVLWIVEGFKNDTRKLL